MKCLQRALSGDAEEIDEVGRANNGDDGTELGRGSTPMTGNNENDYGGSSPGNNELPITCGQQKQTLALLEQDRAGVECCMERERRFCVDYNNRNKIWAAPPREATDYPIPSRTRLPWRNASTDKKCGRAVGAQKI